MAIEDRFPGLNSPSSGAMTFPTTRSVQVDHAAFSDTVDLAFRCRCFVASAAGTLKVWTPDQTDAGGVAIQVLAGLNPQRLDRIFATGSDALVIDIRD
jgi:hypothetical protein